jgi:hypothetical protein
MSGAYKKPDSQRVNRAVPKFEWTALPDARKGPPPKLPSSRKWDAQTRKWWADLWAKPQAVMWDESGQTLWILAALYDDLFSGAVEARKLSGEMRQHEDRHGLNPKALHQLGWRLPALAPPEVQEPPEQDADAGDDGEQESSGPEAQDVRSRRLRVVG